MSSLKTQMINYSPYSIRRALENTACSLDFIDRFAQGQGLLQVDKAYDYLIQTSNSMERDVHFNVHCGGNSRGIYIREVFRLIAPTEYSVTVEPLYLNDANTRKPYILISYELICLY